MAQNVKFIKGNTAKISGTAIVDGQLLYDTTAGLHYIDNGSTRIQVGTSVDSALSTTSTNAIANNAITNSIINTTAEVSAITVDNIPCGTKPVKELINSLTNSIINTTAEVSAITVDNIPCGTKPVKELINSLNSLNITSASYNSTTNVLNLIIPVTT